MKSAIIDGFKRWKDYSGRTSRSQFWWFYLFVVVSPLVTALISLMFTVIFSLLKLQELSGFSVIFFFLYIINIPVFISVGVRRMHDVGKSGWFILVPLYNFYLFVQPTLEKGRIPKWIFAERVSLGFVGILVISVIIGLASGDSDSLAGLVFWTIIYLLIKRKNNSNQKKEN
jgi:uncharacterized membrane protein YhaH (DUF805 family)